MQRTSLKRLTGVLAVCLLLAGLQLPAGAAGKVSKISKRVLRPRSPVTAVVPNLSAVALSTISLQWNWSTNTLTGSNYDGFHIFMTTRTGVLYSSATLAKDTTFYIDTGLEVNKVYTRWISAYDADGHEGSDSQHIDKYTYALPPATLVAIATFTAIDAYVQWQFSAATAYEIQCSTDAGDYYTRNRASFVPWQTIPILSNKQYMVRLAAINGDDEMTPDVYSATRTFTSPPFTVSSFTAVAISSYAVEWRWPAEMFAGTGITGFNIYRSTTTPDANIPTDGSSGTIVMSIGAGTSYWIETFVDSHTVVIVGTGTVVVGTTTFVSTGTETTQIFPAANSNHTRWIKAFGFRESFFSDLHQKYTYGIAPATCTAAYPVINPSWDLGTNYVGLNWDVVLGTHGLRVGIASEFVVDRSTVADFALSRASITATAPPASTSGLESNTKYDFRIGAINGDAEQTPDNAQNPFAYSRTYRVMTMAEPPSDFACDPLTDTVMECAWSTSTYANPEYIEGYILSEKIWGWSQGTYRSWYGPPNTVDGADSLNYTFDYLMTNSTHTVGLKAKQIDPDWNDTNPGWPSDLEYEYDHVDSGYIEADGTTFATPPNDVNFDTVTANSVGTWWKEPEVPATKYRVERSTTLGSAGPWVFISSVTSNHFNDSGLLPSTTYSYRIGAINQLGLQTLGLAEATTGYRRDYSFVRSTVTKHIAPTLYGVAVGTRSIHWSWDDTVSGVTAYNLYTSTGGPIVLGLAASVTWYTEVFLSSANAVYTRMVRSVASDGEGDFSSATVRTLSNPPASVVITSSGTHTLSIGWTANESARYRIDRSTDLVLWTGVKDWGDAFASAAYSDTRLHYAATFYYAVSGYNDDGFVSVSSAITASNMTLPLPSSYTVVYATAAASVAAPLAAPSVTLITADIPAGGVQDGYFAISTSAAASPIEIPKASLDAATAKLTSTVLVSGSIVELHLFDVYGVPADLTAPARLTVTYADAEPDAIVDGPAPQAPADTLNFFNLDTGALVWNQLSDTVVSTTAKTAYSDVEHFSFYALGSVTLPDNFTGAALSTASIQWSWPTEAGADGYRLYTSSAAGYIVLPSSANFYTDAGLAANKPHTRWLKGYSGGSPTSESQHIQRYTYALPPADFALSSVTASVAYLEWYFSTATAYAIECSTDGGATYARNREAFVPWQTIPLLSNKNYKIRIGAINGDNLVTPGLYSSVQSATTPPLDMSLSSAVAVSSYTIQWSWSTGTIAATGITGYRVYGYEGVVYSTTDVSVSSWTETYADGASPAANSGHVRWIKAVGFLESPGGTPRAKYTYAVAPDTCSAAPAAVTPESVGLVWVPRRGPSEASQYVVYYATAGVAESSANFNVAVTSSVVPARAAAITGLAWGTKHDFMIGAINGDGELTPDNALNPYANSGRFKVITRPPAPVNTCSAVTDTILKWSWSTAPYTSAGYVSGYVFRPRLNDAWLSTIPVAGVSTFEYVYDPSPVLYPPHPQHPYLLTNSTHTAAVSAEQSWSPDCSTAPEHAGCYYFFGSASADSMCATFATPPNDLVFATVTARGIGIWWKEPEVPATAYRLERSSTTGEDGPWVFISTVTGTLFGEGGLTPSTTYSYRLGAINRLGVQTIGLSAATDGNRRDYSFVSSTMTRHAAPALYGVATGTGSITWWWTNAVPGVTAYNLYTATGIPLAIGLSSSTTVYYETNLPGANARYNRWSRSVAYDGEGDYSEASVMTLASPPSSAVITSSGAHTLSLGWTASEGPRYKLDRSTDLAAWTGLKAWSDILVSTSYSDSHLRYAAAYYYAVSAYNDDGFISVSSAVTAANMTLSLPSNCTIVSAASAVTATAPLPAPSLALIAVDIPVGTPDGYFAISTDAAASPAGIPKTSLDAATRNIKNAFLVAGSIVELDLFDDYGYPSALASPARITMTYLDAAADGIVDGTLPAASTATLGLFDLDTGALAWNQRQNSVVTAAAKTVYSDVDHFSFYALGSAIPGAFSATALSTTSIKWSWTAVSNVDGYHLYSGSVSTSTYIVLPATASFYVDTGLGVNKAYTRWLKVSSNSVEVSESEHVTKYTYALPPASFTLSTVTAVSAYLEWHYSSATAYAIEGSTDGGTSYYRIRDSFVPWQTVDLMSNKAYRIRIGGVNGDNEVFPGGYSSVQLTTTPPLNMTLTGVAISSCVLQWRWSTDAVADTGITGYRLYRSTLTESDDPANADGGQVLQTLGVSVSSWTEVLAAGAAPPANTRHARWIKAVGLLESAGRTVAKKFTYAVAPATCALTFPDFKNIFADSVNLTWETSAASNYVIEYATATPAQTSADFSVKLTSSIVGGPSSVSGLQGNTKHDFRIGAINGDDEQTPADAFNPRAYSAVYKVLTRPPFTPTTVTPVTDTSLKWSWSTGTYTSLDYIAGYWIGISSHTDILGDFVHVIDFIPGTATTEYTLDYLITNSVHTRWICASQTYPAAGYDAYGGLCLSATGATFATPPNDVSFDTITAHSIGAWWKEPIVPATQYRVERSTTLGENGPWVFVSSVTGNHYVDTGVDISTAGLTASTTYSYRVGAINQLGVQTLGLAEATSGFRRDYSFVESTMTVQRPPVLYGVATGTGSINWWWTNDVSGVLSYNFYTSTDGILAPALTAATTYWPEVNLSSANALYTRRVRSVTTMGESDYAEASVYTWALAPSSLTVTSAGMHYMSIGWEGNGGTRYRIDRSTDMSGWTTLKAWADVLVSTSFADSGLRLATTYYYAASSHNNDGVLSVGSATYSGGPSRTLDLAAVYTPVYSTATVAQSTTVALAGFGTITVQFPAGAAASDGYFLVSTSAATAPMGTSKANMDAASAKLSPSRLVDVSVAELYFYDLYGSTFTGNFTAPARLTFTYTDANGDEILDGITPQVRADNLKLLNLDTAALLWDPLSIAPLNKSARTVYADVPHFSIYALGSILTVTSSLAEVRAYPNPYKPGSSGLFGNTSFGEGIVFEGLTARAKIKIYNLAGALVTELNDDDGDGRCIWNTRNKAGDKAASGLYFYLITTPGASGKKTGKLSIIR